MIDKHFTKFAFKKSKVLIRKRTEENELNIAI